MNIRMPRGAIPSPRNEIAASLPFEPSSTAELIGPANEFPSPNHVLAAAQPYKIHKDHSSATPESFLAWPADISSPEDQSGINSSWAEEAFAKACGNPKVAIPADVLQLAVQKCGSANIAQFMQTEGFPFDGFTYLDGPFFALDWTDTSALHHAISNAAPLKIGIAATSFASCLHGQVTPRVSGWAISGVSKAQPTAPETQHACASLCGYGPLAALVDHFLQNGIRVNVPASMPSGLCFAMFFSGSLGILDRESLLNVTGEAWVRRPVTIVRTLNA